MRGLRTQLGTNKLFYAFDSDYMPHVDETTMVPYDTMHVELDGLVRQELAHLLFVLITKRKRFTMEKLNAAIKSFAWPPGQRMPEIEAKIIEGAKGGVPKADAKLSSSASQTLHFALARSVGSAAPARARPTAHARIDVRPRIDFSSGAAS